MCPPPPHLIERGVIRLWDSRFQRQGPVDGLDLTRMYAPYSLPPSFASFLFWFFAVALLAQQRAAERAARRLKATVAVEQAAVAAAVAELQQQVTELAFYARTVQAVDASPLKAEIQAGHVHVAEAAGEAAGGKGHNARSGRKSGGGRRH